MPLKTVLLVLWSVGIPTYFFFEWFILDTQDTAKPEYKDGCEKAQRAWLAVSATLGLLVVGDYYKATSKDETKAELQSVHNRLASTNAAHQKLQDEVQSVEKLAIALDNQVRELSKK